eukprot:11212113-Lingulodinium_polyedra.AAC.1
MAWSERCSYHLCSRRQSSGREPGMARKSNLRAPCRSRCASAREWTGAAPQWARSLSRDSATRASCSSRGLS